jgi:hypothetical protein
MLSAGAAVVLCTTMLLAASLPAWDRDRGLYRPLARACAAVAVGCLAVGAARPAPLILDLALVVLLSIPWGLAVAHRARLFATELNDGQAGRGTFKP